MSKRNSIFYGLIFWCLALSVFRVEPSPKNERFRIVFESHRDGNGEIYVMDADGRHLKNLTNSPEWEDGFPVCSPDGSKILFGSNRDFNKYGDGGFYVMNADGSNPRLIHIGGGFPRWSPDGSNLKRLTNNPATDSVSDWSPDGRKIVFDSTRDWWKKLRRWRDRRKFGVMFPRDMREIYVMDADGRNQIRLTNNRVMDRRPSFLRVVGLPRANR